MAQGYCKFMRAIGGRGAFAAVRLDFQPASPPTSFVVADSDAVDRHYLPAVETGIYYAQEQLIHERQSPPHGNITVLEISVNFADAHVMFFVYAACMAYCDAVGLDLKRPIEFDRESPAVLLPLGRSRER